MKTLLKILLPVVLVCSILQGNNSVMGQVIAGIVPSGGYVVNPNLNFTVIDIFDDTTGTLDLNCDIIPDMTIQLVKGATAIDGANSIYLYVNNPTYSICSDTVTNSLKLVNYYNSGDVLNCSGAVSWGTDTIYKLGDYGCMVCPGPWTATDKYFAYNDGLNTGWIKVSFDLIDNGGATAPITFSMNEFLTYCNPNSIDENSIENELQIGPNPTADGKINLQLKGKISDVEVYNSIGQKVDFTLEETELILPDVKGVYVVKVKNSIGRSFSKSVVRN